MNRADELREQLAAAEAEGKMLAQLAEAKETFRATGDPSDKESMQDAARAVRAARAAMRSCRDIPPARDAVSVAESTYAADPSEAAAATLINARRTLARIEALLPAGATVGAKVRPAPVGAGTSVEVI